MFESTSSPEARLERLEKLVTEMHSMMRAERRSRRIGSFFKLIYWGALAYGMFYAYTNYLIPIIQQSSQALTQIQDMQKNVSDTTTKLNAGLNEAKSGVDLTKVQDTLQNFLKMVPTSSSTK